MTVKVPVITTQHDSCMPCPNCSAYGIRKSLIGLSHCTWEGNVHESVILLQVLETQVSEIVHSVFWTKRKERKRYACDRGTFSTAISESLSYFKNKYRSLYTTSDQAHVLLPPLLIGIQRTVIRACFLWYCLPLHFPPTLFTHNAPLRLQITEFVWKQGFYRPNLIHCKQNEVNSKLMDQEVCWCVKVTFDETC